MSFGLPSLKIKPSCSDAFDIREGSLGVPDVMVHGFATASTKTCHPLQEPLAKYSKHQEQMNMSILRNTQGLHAPLRIAMELRAVNKVGHLPFLPSYNALRDSLMGRDLEIDPEDIYNTMEFREQMVQPHAIVEKSLNII